MTIGEVFFLMIPAYVANMAPVFARHLPSNARLDFGASFRGQPVFGAHKTWKGLITGVALGTLVGVVVSGFYWPILISPWKWSLAVSFGALAGDAVKSFFKRQMGIKSGEPWVPFDQVDFTIGALAMGSLFYFPGIFASVVVVMASAAAHIAVNHAAFYLKIRDEKW